MHSSVSLSLLVRVPSTVLTSVNGHHVNLEEEAREDSVKIFLVFCNTPVSSIAHNFCALMVRQSHAAYDVHHFTVVECFQIVLTGEEHHLYWVI